MPNCCRSGPTASRSTWTIARDRRPPLLDRGDRRLPRRGEVEVGRPIDGLAGDLDPLDPAEPERAHPRLGPGDEVPERALLDQPERVHGPIRLLSAAVRIADPDLAPVDDGLLQRLEVGRVGGRVVTPPGRVEDDRRGGGLGGGAERLGEGLDQLAQGGLGFGGERRRRAGEQEEGSGLGRREAGQVGAGSADQRPAAVPSRLGVDRDPGHRQRLQVAAGRLHRHLELLGHLGRRHPPARLEEQEGGDEPVGAHGPIIPPEVVTRCPLLQIRSARAKAP